jgi:hypothetical protein
MNTQNVQIKNIRVNSCAFVDESSPRLCVSAVNILLAVFLLTGCATTKVKDPVVPTVSGISDPQSAQLAFWRDLATRKVVCNDDAFHGLLLFLDSTDPNADYNARVTSLKSRKLIPADFNADSTAAVNRGTLAYAVVQALHIQGGWALTLFGPTPRYALRELINMNLFPRSSPEQGLSGGEFLGIIGRVEDYQDGESAFIPAPVIRPQGGE